MEILITLSYFTTCGVRECFNGTLRALKNIWFEGFISSEVEPSSSKAVHTQRESEKIRETFQQCLTFGIIYWLGIYLFRNFILQYVIATYLASYLTADERDSYLWSSLLFSLDWTFFIFWTCLLFAISRMLSYSWYQKVSEIMCNRTGIKKRNTSSISYSLGDQLSSAAVQCLFLLQGYSMFLLQLPAAFQHLWSIVHLSLLYALYAFEYKWVQMGWPLGKRLFYIDSKWPFFVGFGFPLAVLTSYVGSYIEGLCLFSTLFPFYVVSSTVVVDSSLQTFPQPLRIFKAVNWISDVVICGLRQWILK